ncbi:MAG: hypothetical protein KQI35_03090 [Bacteroidetes bacterium]|nr:hypothetical protein [Bacteroidota bacterium]
MKKLKLSGLFFLLVIVFIGCKSDDEPVINGIPITNTSCNAYKSSPDTLSIPSDQSCVYYSYDVLTQRLTLHHKNAGFNCCPGTIYYNPAISDSLIIISEFETDALCDCNCLYDLGMIVQNIEPGIYTLKFIEPYRGDQQELIFEVDLTTNLQGIYCVTRNNYPWRITQ